MVSHQNLSDNKSPELFTVFWLISVMLYGFHLFSYFLVLQSLNQFFGHCSKSTNSIGRTVTFMFPSFFNSLARSKNLYFFSFSFNFILWSAGTVKSTILQILSLSFFLFLIIIRSGRMAEIKWSVCISKSQQSLCVSFSWTDSGLCIYHLFVWSNFNFLHSSQWITLPTQSCLVSYSFCTSLLHLLIMWWIVS